MSRWAGQDVTPIGTAASGEGDGKMSSDSLGSEGGMRSYRARMFSCSEFFLENIEKIDVNKYIMLPTVRLKCI